MVRFEACKLLKSPVRSGRMVRSLVAWVRAGSDRLPQTKDVEYGLIMGYYA